ncbi:MAG: hypothetical protein ACK4FB_09015 [Brevundimonas sp.]|uniref:hypothetical protein n=1 Tax=Brevundimonas sp. TaxID=1871086 RepID=UPI0039192216
MEVLRQSTFTSGALDPTCHGRRDLKPYYSSLAEAENLLPIPQGPIRRRGGLAHVAWIRNQLESVPLDTVTATAPNGGSAAAAISGTRLVTTAGLSTTDPYVVIELDFGEPTAVGLVDLIDFAVVPASYVPGVDDPGAPPIQQPWDPIFPVIP